MYNPIYSIAMGDYIIEKCPELKIIFSKDLSFGNVVIPDAAGEVISVAVGEPIAINMGYDGEMARVFSGYITRVNTAVSFQFADDNIRLSKRISNTFVNALPQDIVKYCCLMANITEYSIDDTHYPQIEKLIIPDMPIKDILKKVNELWQLDAEFGFVDNKFYWGSFPEVDDVYVFNKDNIISLSENELTTVFLPDVKWGGMLELEHEKKSGTFKITQVSHFTSDGFLRTKITFGG